MPKISEFDIQRAVCIWLDNGALFPDVVYWHTPNGGARDAREGKRFKEIGVKAGIPDLFFLRAGRLYGLELKAPGGSQSPAQVAMQPRLAAAGCNYAVVDSLPDARTQLFAWGLIQLR